MRLIATAFCAFLVLLTSPLPLPAQEAASPYVGTWIDADNPQMRMDISSTEGLLRIKAGDGSFDYELACLVNAGKAACMGHGGKLEGESFLYESVIEFADDGSAIERWKAFNNTQSVDGASNWRLE